MNCCSPVVVGRQRRSALTVLQRHRHVESYLALVLSSGFSPSAFSRSGMSLYRDSPGSLVVVNTVPGGPADLAGIRAGDAIVSIADKSATAMMSRELMQTFTQAAGTKVPIVYRRKGQQENATIELRELLP
jgi:C-terminal processing protease CtpA/Prc